MILLYLLLMLKVVLQLRQLQTSFLIHNLPSLKHFSFTGFIKTLSFESLMFTTKMSIYDNQPSDILLTVLGLHLLMGTELFKNSCFIFITFFRCKLLNLLITYRCLGVITSAWLWTVCPLWIIDALWNTIKFS